MTRPGRVNHRVLGSTAALRLVAKQNHVRGDDRTLRELNMLSIMEFIWISGWNVTPQQDAFPFT